MLAGVGVGAEGVPKGPSGALGVRAGADRLPVHAEVTTTIETITITRNLITVTRLQKILG
jgi:hypothetical protein